MTRKEILNKLQDKAEERYPRHYNHDAYEYHRKAYIEGVKDCLEALNII